MDTNVSRRTLLGLAAIGVASIATFRTRGAFAQTPSTLTLPTGSELAWISPWNEFTVTDVSQVLPGIIGLEAESLGQLLIGVYDAPKTIDDAASEVLGAAAGDDVLATPLAGGGATTVNEGVTQQVDSLTYHVNVNDQNWGMYFELVDGVLLTAFAAPVDVFAAGMASAHDAITIDGVNVLSEGDSAELDGILKEFVAASTTGGEFTTADGLLHVQWTNNWTETLRDDRLIELKNPDGSFTLVVQTLRYGNWTFEEVVHETATYYSADQGVDAVVNDQVAQNDVLTLTTNGQYGLRLLKIYPSSDPAVWIQELGAHITVGQAAALLQDAQASVLVNRVPALQGLELASTVING